MTGPILALAGGVGGAKLAKGLSELLAADELTIVVNTGDDETFHGLHVSPDLDTIIYSLAGLANPDTGWGLAGETFRVLTALGRLGAPTWFRLGDADLATHIIRSELLMKGKTLSDVTRELCRRMGVAHIVIPMTDDPVRTIVITVDGAMPFQEYFVSRGTKPRVTGFEFNGAQSAQMAPGFSQALEASKAIVFCPSNPFLSIDPILAIPGVRNAIQQFKGPRAAVSPIIGGEAIKGPAAKIMEELGQQVNCVSVARHLQGLCDIFIIDHVDRAHASTIQSLGMEVLVTHTIMKTNADKIRLATEVLKMVQVSDA